MDEWGRHFPLIFRAFGDYKLPLYIYLTVIPVYLFGLSAFSVRFISALSGVLAIPGIFLLTKELFPDKKISVWKSSIPLEIISAFLLCISPWHFFISRPALEANLALTLIIFGAYYLLRFLNKKSSLFPGLLFLGFSMQAYNTARVFVPLFVIISIIVFSGKGTWHLLKSEKLKNILGIIIFCSSLLLVVSQVYSGEGSARYDKLKILSTSIVFQIGEARSQSKLPSIIAKAIYNRPVYFVSTAVKNYLGYFSPSFIYQTWGAQDQFAIPGKNLLTLPVYLLSILGLIIILFKLKNNKNNQFILIWLLLSPVAAALTSDPPQALRPNPMIPVLIILASLGFIFLLEKSPKKFLESLFVILSVWIVFSFSDYFYNYNTNYKIKYSSAWQYGYSQVINFIIDHGSEYQNIFITKRYGEPHIFYAFFSELKPQDIQPGGDNIRFAKSDWFWTDKIGNVYFINDWQISTTSISVLPLESGGDISTAKSLLVTSPDHIPVNAHVIEKINFLDGSPAFIITSIP